MPRSWSVRRRLKSSSKQREQRSHSWQPTCRPQLQGTWSCEPSSAAGRSARCRRRTRRICRVRIYTARSPSSKVRSTCLCCSCLCSCLCSPLLSGEYGGLINDDGNDDDDDDDNDSETRLQARLHAQTELGTAEAPVLAVPVSQKIFMCLPQGTTRRLFFFLL